MTRVAMSGCNGRMGQTIAKLCAEQKDIQVVAGIDIADIGACPFPVYLRPDDISVPVDVVIDFSNPKALTPLLAYCVGNRIPAVLCTTGYSQEQLNEIQAACQSVPIFKSGNMSLGVNLLMNLLTKAAQILGGGYDVEIIEKHHNQKLDAPSGTAFMLADAIRQGLDYEPDYVYDRHERRQKRGKTEIGLHAVRGGTIVGEHEVIFAGHDEVISFSHSISSREVFAVGAVRAAIFLCGVQKPGLYNMSDLIGEN